MKEEDKDIKEPYEKPEVKTEEMEIGVYGVYTPVHNTQVVVSFC